MPFSVDQNFTITQVGDELWRLEKDLIYFDSEYIPGAWTIKEGVIYDGSSIPRIVWSLIGHPLWGPLGVCGFLHDDLYRNQYNRKKADKVYVEALDGLGFSKWKQPFVYWALRLFGGFAYDRKI